jgi:long-chain acyl-CoA synthetase
MSTGFVEIRDQLTGAGGAFEIGLERVDGVETKMYRQRFKSLREVAGMAAAYGDREAVVFEDQRFSYARFMQQANGLAAELAARHGIGRGDRVAVLAANCPQWAQTFWATVSLGAICVGLNGWWTADEVAYGLEHSGAKVLVVDAPRLQRVAPILAALAEPVTVYLIGAEAANLAVPGVEVLDFADLLGSPTDTQPNVEIDEGDPAVIFYTSGTTGRPKGAISTHRSMIANLQNSAYLATVGRLLSSAKGRGDQSGSQPTSLLTSPLFHVAGCHSALVVGMTAGMRIVMMGGKFTPEKALELIQSERVTMWSAVPTMIWRTTELETRHQYDTSSVTAVAFGGSPSAAELQRRIRETFPNVTATTNAYGLTETSSVATALVGEDAIGRPDSVGLPMPVVDVAIADVNGNRCAADTTGEVLIRGPVLMAGYWNNPEATAAAIRDGWLHTGDVGHLDADGYLFITDRAKDMIIRGGENVYCVEVENRLVEHPSIADAAVIGVEHPELGEQVAAVIEVAPGQEISDEELQVWVGETLAKFKVPELVRRWDGKLPRNASGKLLKPALRGDGQSTFAETM